MRPPNAYSLNGLTTMHCASTSGTKPLLGFMSLTSSAAPEFALPPASTGLQVAG